VTLPLAAGAAGPILLDLFIVLVAAKIGDEVFKRLGQPSVIGEILAGVIVGPSVLGLVELTDELEVFAELGVVFLLFWVGLETRLSEMRSVGRAAIAVGVLGMVIPFAGGLGFGFATGEEATASLFLGACLVATSVGITSAVLVELGALTRPASRTILGAAVVDDILAMLLLAVAAGLAAEGSIDAFQLALVIGMAMAFVLFVGLGGTALLRRQPRLLHRPRFSESPLMPAVILGLGLAALAAEIGLAAVIGAFLAGMIVAETREQHPIEEEVAPLYAFFPPFFFVAIGIQVDLGAFAGWETIGLLAAVTAIAIATKFAGAWLGARSLGRREAVFVGIGMVPRGEVGIIVAGIAKTSGVIGQQLFVVVVGMSIITTLFAPPLLRLLLRREQAAA
jgi:Kef-type K+ transport system membrane component KefB